MGVAVVFPGQGTQVPGMGTAWRAHPSWDVVERAEAALGEPLAHLIIDAGVDTEWVRNRIKEREGEAALANLDPGRLMRPAAVAEAYWQIYQEPRDAWSFEREIRPFAEKW